MRIKVIDKDYTIEHVMRDRDNPDYCPIDFEVRDREGSLVATVWGDKDSVEIDCDHSPVGMTDIEECGYCEICGAECHWHIEKQYDDEYEIMEKVVDGYDPLKEIPKDSLIGRELTRIKEVKED